MIRRWAVYQALGERPVCLSAHVVKELAVALAQKLTAETGSRHYAVEQIVPLGE